MAMRYEDIPMFLHRLRRKYYIGSAGVGGYTIDKDADGYYWSFFLRPAGHGARGPRPEYYKYVARLTTRRRTRNACAVRSRNLSRGKNATADLGPRKARHSEPGTGYCMREKKTVFVNFTEEFEASNGRTMIRGNCKDCGTKVQKYGRLVNCGECGHTREGKADDYLCRWCRDA